MTFSLTWLPQVLMDAGLKVATVPGWETRGARDVGPILGIICHHTAGSSKGNMPTLGILTNGRAAGPGVTALPGPLSQLGLGRDGTFYVISAGRCNHAGAGSWNGMVNGNSNFIGIEAEHTGRASEPWPEVQLDAYRRGVAAILKHVGRSANDCCAHREYAMPAGRKSDPPFDMHAFRSGVAAFLSGVAVPPPLIPSVEPTGTARPTLRRGAKGPDVMALQQRLKLPNPDGDFGSKTEAAVREFQRKHGMVPDGIVGPKSWAKLDEASS